MAFILNITKTQLLEAGVHFGHKTNYWNPKMKPYIYTKKNNIHIIDLQQTTKKLNEAVLVISQMAAEGKKFLFVGMRNKVKALIKDEAIRANAYYVNERWLGGTLTNFKVIQKKINKLWEIERNKKSGVFDNLPTKEQFIIDKQQKQLEKLVSGIKAMNHLPDALFIVNLKYTMTAALEAKKMNIPIFAMVDTDSDPDIVSHIIPANDDSIKSINLIITHVVDAILQKSDFSVPTPPSDQQVTDPLTTINGAQSLNNPTDLPNLSATDDNPIPEIDN